MLPRLNLFNPAFMAQVEMLMRLTPPMLELSPTEGFAQGKDLFGRESFGQALMWLVTSINEPLVISLDAPWGEGKTTFIKMWQGLLHQHDIPCIYFDAFANDFIDDPFLAIAGEIYELAKCELGEDSGKLASFKEKAVSVGKILFKSTAKIAVKAGTAGLLDRSVLEDLGAAGNIADEASTLVERYIEQKLEGRTQEKGALEDFKETLTKLAGTLANDGKPLVYIIDEMDRCRPPFALELLERIKHVFSVQGLVFVLVNHSDQLQESVKDCYGPGINAAAYLRKFFSLHVTLPKNTSNKDENDSRRFISHLLDSMEIGSSANQRDDYIDTLTVLARHFRLSLRDLERIASYLAIYMASTKDQDPFAAIICGLCVMKVIDPTLFGQLVTGNLDQGRVRQFFDLDKPSQDQLFKSFKYWWQFFLDKNLDESQEWVKGISQVFARTGYIIDERTTLLENRAKRLTLFDFNP